MDTFSMDSEVQVLLCEECSAAFLNEDDFKLHRCVKREVPSPSENSSESSFGKRVHNESGYLDNANENKMSDKLVIHESGPSGSSLDLVPAGSELKSLEHYSQKANISKIHLSNPGQANFITETSKGCIHKHIVLNTSHMGKDPVSSRKVLTHIKPVTGSSRVFLVPIRPNVPVQTITYIQTSNTSVKPRPQVLRFNNQRPVHHISSTESPKNSSQLPTRIVKINLARPACNNTNDITYEFLNGHPQLTSTTSRINDGRIVKIVPKGMIMSVNRLMSFQSNKPTTLNETVVSNVTPQKSSDIQLKLPENAEAINGEPVNENLTSNQADTSHHVEHVANKHGNKTETEMQDDDFFKELIIDENPVAESNPEEPYSCEPNQIHQESDSKERFGNNSEKCILSPKHMTTDKDPNQKTDISISGENFVALSNRLSCESSETAIIKQETTSKELEVPVLGKPAVTHKTVRTILKINVKGAGKNSGVANLLKDPSIEKLISEHVKRIQKDNTDQKPICISIRTSAAAPLNYLRKSKAKVVRSYNRQAVSENINQSLSQNYIVQKRNAVSNNQPVTRYEPGYITEKAGRRLIDKIASRFEPATRTLCNTDIENIHTSVDASTGNRITGIDVKPYVCKTCLMVMDSEWELDAHRTSCEGDKCVEVKVEGFRCCVCSERFSDEATFDEHREICSADVYNTSRLADIPTEFLNIANNNIPYCVGDSSGSKSVYNCGMCGKEFQQRWFLSRHMKIHSQEKDFICTICGQGFSYKHNLKNHMGIHGDDRPYKCEVCDATFKYPNNLSKHKTTHKPDAVKKFKCRHCNRGFKENYHRERHEVSHAPQRTIECQLCDLTFSRHDNLKQHMKRIHSDDARAKGTKRKCRRQPWRCSLCGQKFLWRKYFISHMEMFHPGVETPELKQARLGVRDKCNGSENDNDGGVDEDDIDEIGKEEYNSDSDDDDIELDSEEDEKAITNVEQCEKLTCSECDRVFRSEGNLQRHMRFMHDQD